MSSLRNAHSRRNHKERSQPAARQKLGLLEKHKDYVQRARDYNSKKDRLRRLREKAADRNKDEFYFGMIRGKTKNGVHIQDRESSVALPHDLIKILKTQDAAFIHTQRSISNREIEKLRLEIGALSDLRELMDEDRRDELNIDEAEYEALQKAALLPSVFDEDDKRCDRRISHRLRNVASIPRGKVIFTDDAAIAEIDDDLFAGPEIAQSSSLEEQGEDNGDLGWIQNKKSKKSQKPAAAPLSVAFSEKERNKHLSKLLKLLAARCKRNDQLQEAMYRIEDQTNRMSKTGKRRLPSTEAVTDETTGETTGPVKRFKWSTERKR